MEPAAKKTKLTDHFRVALRPRDLNIVNKHHNTNGQQQQHQLHQQQPAQLLGKSSQQSTSTNSQTLAKSHQQVEVITIGDEDDTAEICDQNHNLHNTHQREHKSILPKRKQSPSIRPPSFSSSQPTLLLQSSSQPPPSQPPSPLSQPKQLKKLHLQHINKYSTPIGKAEDILDYDKSLLNNVCWEPYYAQDSFDYDRLQEVKFRTSKYLNLQSLASILIPPQTEHHQNQDITPLRRAELVDWLVEIQMRFSLDHEPLYMAVKLADRYLMRKYVSNQDFILLYLTSILISAKYDERVPPVTIPDLIQITKVKFGVKYTKRQILTLEVDLLTTLDFDIRFPLSYGFLRRFARCTRSDMRTINLARYILESSLMDYDMIDILDSKIAAGSLLLAFEMLNLRKAWDSTAKFYTGYEEKDLYPLIIRMNKMLLKFARRKTAIRRKYSHESFMEVARIPPMLPELLLLLTESSDDSLESIISL